MPPHDHHGAAAGGQHPQPQEQQQQQQQQEEQQEQDQQGVCLSMLPTHVLATVLDHLGEDAGAAAVVRAATACRALWRAAAGPLARVRRVSATVSGSDLSAEELAALLRRFPGLCELQLRQGSWEWAGLRTLPALARQLRSLQADHTALPLLRPTPTTMLPLLPALRHLQLRGIITTAAAARGGSWDRPSTGGDPSQPPDCLLAQLLANSLRLTSLDLAGNTGLPDAALSAALRGRTSLRALSLSGASSLRCPGACVAAALGGGQLRDLDLSKINVVDDFQLQDVVCACSALTRLAINDCKRVGDDGIRALSAASCLVCLELCGLTRPSSAALAQAVHAFAHHHHHQRAPAAAAPPPQLALALSRTAGVTDSVLLALLGASGQGLQTAQQPRQLLDQPLEQVLEQLSLSPDAPGLPRLSRLELMGCNAISAAALLQLAACGVLQPLTSLDLAECEALRLPAGNKDSSGSRGSVAGSSAAASRLGSTAPAAAAQEEDALWQAAANSRSVLARLLPLCCSSQLQSLCVDSSLIDDAGAAALAALRCLERITELSLVGVRGLSAEGMLQLLSTAPRLARLAAGGSAGSCFEGVQLAALPCTASLTQLQLFRRPVLRDADLAPVLAAASRLRSLSLVGCHMLTDALFLGPALHSQLQLTQLVISACDRLQGSSIGTLKALRHLRLAFCPAVTPAAAQALAVACSRLVLLELPADLQLRQPRGRGPGGAAQQLVPMPQQGRGVGGGHLQRLRVVWLP